MLDVGCSLPMRTQGCRPSRAFQLQGSPSSKTQTPLLDNRAPAKRLRTKNEPDIRQGTLVYMGNSAFANSRSSYLLKRACSLPTPHPPSQSPCQWTLSKGEVRLRSRSRLRGLRLSTISLARQPLRTFQHVCYRPYGGLESHRTKLGILKQSPEAQVLEA